ncbi:MAG: hypothetical protein EZS28_000103 [Streblomastix strix]|uniref:Uncharacterized protein n=1 Tax=Streblomastix strix TaxID=222440 RepID=A0A5J4XAS3_9EUKA|nr:MAG: hypothetical protein EZS28_000103 [Streblomastix strix]
MLVGNFVSPTFVVRTYGGEEGKNEGQDKDEQEQEFNGEVKDMNNKLENESRGNEQTSLIHSEPLFPIIIQLQISSVFIFHPNN